MIDLRIGTQAGLPELLLRTRGGGRRLSLLLWSWDRGCRRFLLLLGDLPVMMLVLRLALGGLGGLGYRLIRRLRRRSGGLRGLLCRCRQRHCKYDERPAGDRI